MAGLETALRLVGVATLVAASASAPFVGARADEAPPSELADDPAIEEIKVSGIRTGRFIDAPSAFTTDIDLDDYAGEGKSVDDLLSEQTGVQVRRFGGAGEPATLSIRGSSAQQVDLTLNGVRLNSPLSGASDVSELCLGLVDGVSVTRGGPGAIGGRVDLSSPISTGERVVAASGEASSFGTWRGQAHYADTLGVDADRPTTTGLDLAIGYCGFKTDGDYSFQRPLQDNGSQVIAYDPPSVERINNDQQKHSGQIGLGLPIGERHRIELRDYVSWQRGGAPGLDAGTGELAGQDPDARSEDLFNLAHLTLRSEDVGLVGDEASFSLFHRYQADDYDDPAEPGAVVPDVAIRTRIHNAGASSLQRWERDALGATHRVGLTFTADRDAVYVSDRDDQARTNVSGELNLASAFFDERVVISPGLRTAWSQGFDPAVLPSLGAVVTPLPWLRFKANGFRSWRVPSFEELYHPDRGFIRGNEDLDSEQAWGADFGAEIVLEQLGPLSSLTFALGGFYQDRDREIVWTQVSPWVVAPVNLPSTRFIGLETSLAAEWTRFVGFALNHTEVNGELETTGRGVPGRAERESYARLRVGPAEIWKLVGEWQYTGEIPVSLGGNVMLPARHVVNVSASLDLVRVSPWPLGADSLRAWLSVDNVGDVAIRDALFSPQPGRTLSLGLEAAW